VSSSANGIRQTVLKTPQNPAIPLNPISPIGSIIVKQENVSLESPGKRACVFIY